ncbi:AraC family transcriptional regulator [Pelagicoccus sp. SDUM812002]|nr:AraC family transcriptional regulator [Pelagicoccus sp. SDUM812002]
MSVLLGNLATGQGFSASRLSGVKFMRSTEHVPPSPITYEPSIVFIAQGKKRGRLGDQRFVYDPNNYLVMSAPVPFECETFGTSEEPLLGLSISVTPVIVAELLVQLESAPHHAVQKPHAIESAPTDDALSDAAIRLLKCLDSADDTNILGPQIIREIVYRVLTGPSGANLRGLASPQSHFGQITRALNVIHTNYAGTHDIETLASQAGMSVSTFHTHFKNVTASSPLQYIKTIRLHKARMLMVHHGLGASAAAIKVGYESASQFSREFKRHFGGTPAEIASQLRSSLTRFA